MPAAPTAAPADDVAPDRSLYSVYYPPACLMPTGHFPLRSAYFPIKKARDAAVKIGRIRGHQSPFVFPVRFQRSLPTLPYWAPKGSFPFSIALRPRASVSRMNLSSCCVCMSIKALLFIFLINTFGLVSAMSVATRSSIFICYFTFTRMVSLTSPACSSQIELIAISNSPACKGIMK